VNAVAMPMRATTHIQKIAPGPPRVSAMATPVMLPVPTREESPMQNAWNGEIPLLAFLEVARDRIIAGNSRNWTKRVRMPK